jgi:hypothetical protein
MTFRVALRLACFTLAGPLLIMADGVTISSSCSLTNYTRSPFVPITTVSQAAAGNCNLTLANPTQGIGAVGTSTFVTLDLPVLGNPSAPVGAQISASAFASPSTDSVIDTVLQSGSAAISLALNLSFSTSGPARAGYIQFSAPASLGVNYSNGGDRPDSQTAGISVGALSLTCPGSPNTDPFNFCGGSLQAPRGTLLPFSLGENFLFHEDAAMLAVTDARPSAIENGIVSVNFTFRLFEADGVTPVPIALATPEPASSWLAACGCLCLLLARRRRPREP